jgi:hypothetical protein
MIYSTTDYECMCVDVPCLLLLQFVYHQTSQFYTTARYGQRVPGAGFGEGDAKGTNSSITIINHIIKFTFRGCCLSLFTCLVRADAQQHSFFFFTP